MKKFALCLLACLACVQFSHAATSALTESILEIEAIFTSMATQFPDVIKPNEFIVDVSRKTKKLNVNGTVKYWIETCHINDNDKCKHTHLYQAVLDVAPNPGIGPKVITVLSLKKVHVD